MTFINSKCLLTISSFVKLFREDLLLNSNSIFIESDKKICEWKDLKSKYILDNLCFRVCRNRDIIFRLRYIWWFCQNKTQTPIVRPESRGLRWIKLDISQQERETRINLNIWILKFTHFLPLPLLFAARAVFRFTRFILESSEE